jgi:hypothetical protein
MISVHMGAKWEYAFARASVFPSVVHLVEVSSFICSSAGSSSAAHWMAGASTRTNEAYEVEIVTSSARVRNKLALRASSNDCMRRDQAKLVHELMPRSLKVRGTDEQTVGCLANRPGAIRRASDIRPCF